MSLIQKIKTYWESFAGRLFLSFAGLALLGFTLFYSIDLLRERKAMRQNVVNKGNMLSTILAYHARAGLFAENRDMLKATVVSVVQSRDVAAVRIYDRDKRLLYDHQTGGIPEEAFRELPAGRELLLEQAGRKFAPELVSSRYLLFSTPVILEQASDEAALFFESGMADNKREFIGSVVLLIDWEYHEKKLKSHFVYGIGIGLIFLLAGGVMSYRYIGEAAKPLLFLAKAIRSFGEGKPFGAVPVKSNNEVGLLAGAFNEMVETLKSKEAERQRLEIQFRQAQKMEAVGTMAGGISHDFKNILTAISGFSNLAKMSLEKDDPAREYVEHILTSSARAATLVQSLLAYSRQQVINPKAVDLNTIVAGIEKMLRRLIREDIRLVLNLSHERLSVMADTGQIDQVLMNLCTNARDAMPEGGTVSISTSSAQLEEGFFQNYGAPHPGAYAVISVADTGLGIERDTIKMIYDPFFTTKEVGKGSGLGLSIVYGIVKQHGGYIDVKSEPGKCTVFSVYLPLIHSDDLKEQAMAAVELKRGSETILVAEDDDEVRKYIYDMLRLFGYRVLEAADGDEAVRVFSGQPGIDLLLLDVIMQGKSGKEVFDAIRIMSPQIKALFLSGHPVDIINKRGIINEGVNFISKPVSPEELLVKIREILDNQTQ